MDRHVLRRRPRAVVVAAVSLAGAVASMGGACSDLDQIDGGYCGNRVVEEGEDCDGVRAGETYQCGERDSQHACRYVWTDTTPCPSEYVASADQRCRKPSGVYKFDGAVVPLAGSRPAVADIDGDGVLEVAVQEVSDGIAPQRLDIYSVSGGATRFATFPGVYVSTSGDVSGDGEADVIVGVQGDFSTPNAEGAGISVFRSPSLDLKFYARDLLAEDLRFVMLPSWIRPDMETAQYELDEVAIVRKQGQGVAICFVDTPCNLVISGLDPDMPVSVDYDDAQMVLSSPGGSTVLVAPRAAQVGELPPEIRTVGLTPGAHLVTGARLADIDGDGLDDLIAIGSLSGMSYVFVLPGSPAEEGHYPEWSATDRLEPWLSIEFPVVPLRFEAAHLNHDAIADLVIGSSILVSRGDTPSAPTGDPAPWMDSYALAPGDSLWSEDGFALGDLNGDGLDDIVVQSFGVAGQGPPSVKGIFGGDLLPLVEVVLLDQSTMTHAAIADFDGDGNADLLASLAPQGTDPATTRTCDSLDELVAVYGRPGAYPEPAVSIGALPAVVQIASGRFTQPTDGFGDFAVAAACDSGSTHEVKNAVLLGNSDRLVNTPFTFNPDTGASGVFVPYVVAAGDVVTLDSLDEKGDNGNIVPHDDVVLVGSEGAKAYVLPSWGDAELDASLAIPLALDEVFLTGDLQIDASPHMVGFLSTSSDDLTSETGVRFMANVVPDEGPAAATSILELPALQGDLGSDGYYNLTSKLASGDLDGDGDTDFIAVYGYFDSSGVFTGKPAADNGMSEPAGPATSGPLAFAVILQDQGAFSVLDVSGLPEGDAPVGVAKLDGALVLVSRLGLHRIDVASGTLVDVAIDGAWPALAADAGVGDFNGDGLEDVLVLDGQSAYLLEQLPENP